MFNSVHHLVKCDVYGLAQGIDHRPDHDANNAGAKHVAPLMRIDIVVNVAENGQMPNRIDKGGENRFAQE